MADGPDAEKGTHGDLAPGGEPVALSALIEHGVRLEWHEAVAVVRDICQLLRGGDPLEPVPDLRHIWICANGRMAIAPGTLGGRASSEQPVATLGRLLFSLVDEARMPVQLRIRLSAASTAPAYGSADEFSNALAHFERPSGALPIRPVYRWHQLAAESDAPAAVQPLPPDSPPSSSPPPAPQNVVDLSAPPDALDLFLPEEKVVTLHGRSFPVFPIVAALAAILVATLILATVILVATLILAWSFSGRSRLPPGPTQTAQAPVQETASGAMTPTSLIAEDVELDATDGSAARGSAVRRSGPASGLAVRGALLAEARAFGIAGAAPALPSRLRAGSAPAAPSRRQPALDERLPVPTGEPPDAIYSSADQDVEPPVLVRPKVSIGPRTGTEPEGMTVLNLLISEAGQVEAIAGGAGSGPPRSDDLQRSQGVEVQTRHAGRPLGPLPEAHLAPHFATWDDCPLSAYVSSEIAKEVVRGADFSAPPLACPLRGRAMGGDTSGCKAGGTRRVHRTAAGERLGVVRFDGARRDFDGTPLASRCSPTAPGRLRGRRRNEMIGNTLGLLPDAGAAALQSLDGRVSQARWRPAMEEHQPSIRSPNSTVANPTVPVSSSAP
jgi:hypothetical protein